LVFLQSEDKSGLPTAQQAEKKRKEIYRVSGPEVSGSNGRGFQKGKERRSEFTWGPPGSAGGGQSEARYREKGVNRGRWVSGSAR